MTKQEIADYMRELIAEASGEPVEQIDENTSFFKIGISSIDALKIMNKIRKRLQVNINPVAISFSAKDALIIARFVFCNIYRNAQ